MIEEKRKKLEKELKYLTKEVIKKEVNNNLDKLEKEDISIKDLAKNIYLKRGIDYSKIKGYFIYEFVESIASLNKIYKENDKQSQKKMIMEFVYIIIVLLLVKIPFDLIRDIGYEYIKILTSNNIFYTLWNFIFLLIYTITIIYILIIFIRNFSNKYKKF